MAVLKRMEVGEENFPKDGKHYAVWTPQDSVGWVQATYIFKSEDLEDYDALKPFWMDRDGFEVFGVTEYSSIK